MTERCTFRVATRGGVWRVSRDAAFFGDFLTRDAAVRAACLAAQASEAKGRHAQVLAPPRDEPLPHHGPYPEL